MGSLIAFWQRTQLHTRQAQMNRKYMHWPNDKLNMKTHRIKVVLWNVGLRLYAIVGSGRKRLQEAIWVHLSFLHI